MFFFVPSQKMQFFKMAAQKACEHDNLYTVSWIALKFVVVVLYVFLMIWLTSGLNPLG